MEVSICTQELVYQMLENYGKFTNMADSKEYAKKRLKPFTTEQLQTALGDFRVVLSSDIIVASAYFHPGGWIQEASFSDTEAFTFLVSEANKQSLAEGEDPYFFQLNNYPESTYAKIEEALTKINYVKDTDFDMKLSIFGLHYEKDNYIDWTENKDSLFEQVYKKTTRNPYPWQIIKFQTGGGKFEPRLWKISEDNDSIIGVNSATKITYNPNIYTIVTASGNEASLKTLVQASLADLASMTPDADVVTHCLSKKLSFYEAFGFQITGSRPYFRVPLLNTEIA
jgi:hypothetical protein